MSRSKKIGNERKERFSSSYSLHDLALLILIPHPPQKLELTETQIRSVCTSVSCESKQTQSGFKEVFLAGHEVLFILKLEAKCMESEKLLQVVLVQLATDFENLIEMFING